VFANALNEDIAMHRSTGRVFVTVCLFAGAALFAPAVLAQAEEDSAAPAQTQPLLRERRLLTSGHQKDLPANGLHQSKSLRRRPRH